MTRTLILIFAALALIIGSFIWFVVTWDAAAEVPVSMSTPATAPFIWPSKLAPQGPPAAGALFIEKGTT